MKMNISALKAKLFPAKTGTGNKTESGNEIPREGMDILDHLEKIVEMTQELGIDKCLSEKNGGTHVDYVAGKLGISPVQAVIFSHLLDIDGDGEWSYSEIAESLQCSKIRIKKYLHGAECKELEKKKLVRFCRETGIITAFRIPLDVKNSLTKFNEYRPEKNENVTIAKFFASLEQLFDERETSELTFESMATELQELIKLNMHLEFCKKIMSYNLDESDLVLLACFCHLCCNNNNDSIGTDDFMFLYEDKSIFTDIKLRFFKGNHPLIDSKFIEFTKTSDSVNSYAWKLSNTAKKELLSELNVRGRDYRKNLMLFDAIKPKKMFYNARENEAIQTLVSLLSNENYNKIQERLEGKGMRKGFACLFSGLPGTGKTETAYQIARETKRNIMKIDISEIKSCWYGESEKKTRAIFDTYRAAVEDSETAPILLINEADAVIGKRIEFSQGNRAIDQVENTIQNIILEEMENLSGILIATTNLTQNMDKAYERRFLYKICFGKPGKESRMGIWNTLLPGLPQDTTKELSGSFELTGGQIENIARKIEVDSILKGSEPSMDVVVQYCRLERQNSLYASKTIGFEQ